MTARMKRVPVCESCYWRLDGARSGYRDKQSTERRCAKCGSLTCCGITVRADQLPAEYL